MELGASRSRSLARRTSRYELGSFVGRQRGGLLLCYLRTKWPLWPAVRLGLCASLLRLVTLDCHANHFQPPSKPLPSSHNRFGRSGNADTDAMAPLWRGESAEMSVESRAHLPVRPPCPFFETDSSLSGTCRERRDGALAQTVMLGATYVQGLYRNCCMNCGSHRAMSVNQVEDEYRQHLQERRRAERPCRSRLSAPQAEGSRSAGRPGSCPSGRAGGSSQSQTGKTVCTVDGCHGTEIGFAAVNRISRRQHWRN